MENNESTIMEKLAYLEGTKDSIKNAIIAQGQEVSANDTFRSYAQKIANIETGYDTSDATAVANDIVRGKIAYNSTGKITGTVKEYNSTSEAYKVPCYDGQVTPEEQVMCNNNLDSSCTSVVLSNGVIVSLNSLPIDVHDKNIVIWHVISKNIATQNFYDHAYILGIAPNPTDVFWIDPVNYDVYCANEAKTASVTASYYKWLKQDPNSDYIALDNTFTSYGPGPSYNTMYRSGVALEGVYSTNILYQGTKLSDSSLIRNKGASTNYAYYQKVNNGQYTSPSILKAQTGIVTLLNNSKLATAIGLTANKIAEGEKILGIEGTFQGGEDLSAELTAQEQKLAELEAALENKTAGANVKPNIFVQTTEPEIKKGLWLQTNKTAEHYKSDDSIYFSGTWSNTSETANVPFSFSNSSGKLVVVGTDIHLFQNSNHYKYDTMTKTYTQLSNLPYTCDYPYAAAVGTDIYIFGGTSSTIKTVHKYDTLTDTYTQLSNLSFSLYSGGVVAIGTNIYLFVNTSAYKYDTLTSIYTRLADIPFNFYNGATLTATDTAVYLYGGYSDKSQVYRYNVLADNYTKLTNVPFNYYSGGVASIGTDVYIFGGPDFPTRAYKYNALTDTYTQITSIPFNCNYGFAVTVGSYIYVLYGTNNRRYCAQTKTYETDNTVIIAQGRAGVGKTYNSGYSIELFDTTFDEGFQPLYGLVDAWFYTTQDGIILDIPTYYGDGTQWINFKNPPSNS